MNCNIILYFTLFIIILYILQKKQEPFKRIKSAKPRLETDDTYGIYRKKDTTYPLTPRFRELTKEKKLNMERYDRVSKMKNQVCRKDINIDPDNTIRERLVNGIPETCQYDREDLVNYRDIHFGFRNSINQTSHDIDAIDKLNDLYVNNDFDYLKNMKGKTIGGIFDSITKNEFLPENSCITNRVKPIERIAKEDGFLEDANNGQFVNNLRFKYDNEKTMNGGNFYDNIVPFESISSYNRAL